MSCDDIYAYLHNYYVQACEKVHQDNAFLVHFLLIILISIHIDVPAGSADIYWDFTADDAAVHVYVAGG